MSDSKINSLLYWYFMLMSIQIILQAKNVNKIILNHSTKALHCVVCIGNVLIISMTSFEKWLKNYSTLGDLHKMLTLLPRQTRQCIIYILLRQKIQILWFNNSLAQQKQQLQRTTKHCACDRLFKGTLYRLELKCVWTLICKKR